MVVFSACGGCCCVDASSRARRTTCQKLCVRKCSMSASSDSLCSALATHSDIVTKMLARTVSGRRPPLSSSKAPVVIHSLGAWASSFFRGHPVALIQNLEHYHGSPATNNPDVFHFVDIAHRHPSLPLLDSDEPQERLQPSAELNTRASERRSECRGPCK